MSVSPAPYNIAPQRRADYILSLQFKDSTNVAINLTGYIVYAQVWDKSRTTKYADFTVTYVDRAQGRVKIALSDTQTTTLPDECFYDVMLENPSGIREYYLEGNVYVSQGYTSP